MFYKLLANGNFRTVHHITSPLQHAKTVARRAPPKREQPRVTVSARRRGTPLAEIEMRCELAFVLRKSRDEGASCPYIARIYAGILDIRDYAIRSMVGYDRIKVDEKRLEFDNICRSMYDALDTFRIAGKNAVALVSDYKYRLPQYISFDNGHLRIDHTIDIELRAHISSFIVHGAIAMKEVQKCAKFFGVDIGFVFSDEKKFRQAIEELISGGRQELVDFLVQTRDQWGSKFIKRRNLLEHNSWSLQDISFITAPVLFPAIREPDIDGYGVTEYVNFHINHVLNYVENIMVYSFQGAIDEPYYIFEVPASERNPDYPRRFEVGFNHPENEWVLYYSCDEFG